MTATRIEQCPKCKGVMGIVKTNKSETIAFVTINKDTGVISNDVFPVELHKCSHCGFIEFYQK